MLWSWPPHPTTDSDGDPAVADVPWLRGVEGEAWRSFIETSRWVHEMLDRDLKVHGLTGDDYAVLVVLAEQPNRRLRMRELAERVYESKSRLSHHVGRLEAKGLVRREACPSDGRGLNAVLTDEGAASRSRPRRPITCAASAVTSSITSSPTSWP